MSRSYHNERETPIYLLFNRGTVRHNDHGIRRETRAREAAAIEETAEMLEDGLGRNQRYWLSRLGLDR